MSLENQSPRSEHRKIAGIWCARRMRRKELKSLLPLLEEMAGEGGYVEMLLATPTRAIQRKVTCEDVDSYLDELTKGERVQLFQLTIWAGTLPFLKRIRVDLGNVSPEIEVLGRDRTWVIGTAERLNEEVKRWDKRLLDLSVLLRPGLHYGIALVVALATFLLRTYGGLALPHPFTVAFMIVTLTGGLGLGLLVSRPDLIRPIRIDFYVPEDEEREKADKRAERIEKLVWLAIGVVFTVVAELVGYWVLKKLGWL